MTDLEKERAAFEAWWEKFGPSDESPRKTAWTTWQARAALAGPGGAVALPMDTAPKDGTWVALLVDYSAAEPDAFPLEDSSGPLWTLGSNNFESTKDDEWVFMGWDWCHDCIVETRAGELLGWAPFPSALAAHPDAALPDLGRTYRIEHDGFEGEVIGHYRTREGKEGVVLQQAGTRVVHVYGRRWLKEG